MRKILGKLFNPDKDEKSAGENSTEVAAESNITSEKSGTDTIADLVKHPGSADRTDMADESASQNTLLTTEAPAPVTNQPVSEPENGAATENPIETTAIASKNMRTPIDDTAISARPLEVHESERTSPLLQAAHCCHIGNIRHRNEDSTFLFTAEAGGQEPLLPFGLYVVADGMGGHHAGHEASRVVSRIVAQHVLERIYLPLIKRSTQTPTQPQEPIQDVVLEAIQIANRQIHSTEPGLESGTTLTTALLFGRRLYITHVGDSRAYLLDSQNFKQLTTDHSYVRRLVDAGDLTEEEAAVHPQRNMLYKAVGQGGTLEIDTFTQTLPKEGLLMLCSDGLWGLVSDQEIKSTVEKKTSLSNRANSLVDLALEAGGHDNISAILVSFKF